MDRLECMKMAVKYYPEKKLAHAVRVATYAADQPFADQEVCDSLWVIGLFHDLLEDTKCTPKELWESKLVNSLEYEAIILLTHHKEDESYESYMKNLAEEGNEYARIVKRADMKDHLMLTETLTDKLKAKYYPTIKYIL